LKLKCFIKSWSLVGPNEATDWKSLAQFFRRCDLSYEKSYVSGIMLGIGKGLRIGLGLGLGLVAYGQD